MTGWTHNTPDDTPTDGPRIAAICTAFTAAAFVLVCLRLYVRTMLVKAVGWETFLLSPSHGNADEDILTDDWVIIVSWTKWGLGITRLEDMPDEDVLNFGKVRKHSATFSLIPLTSFLKAAIYGRSIRPSSYVVGIWGFKMSLLCSYLRFFPVGGYKTGTIIVAVACTMAHIAFIFVFLFLCTPVEKQYDPSVPAEVGHCVDAVAFYMTFSSLTIVFDVLIMFLPFPVILRSQIQNRKKVVLLALFVLGGFVTVIQAIRIQTIQNLVNYLDSAKTIQWSVIETCIGIIIACVPPLAPMVKYFADRSRCRSGGGRSRGSGPPTNSSRYVLQTWGTKRSGMQPLGMGVDREASVVGSLQTKAEDSTENILESSGAAKATAAPGAPVTWSDKDRRQDV
ncbi:Integral membrane protein [Colletotrichum higginsianum IMI 349063]|uniref:Integral membrane protein n=1 Tax=Colletotrichum higginsianum (strain IMI 349063) TaxID=759273 RepID=A0A1B7XXY6_COLHI|nr:Integral membrane protein [Colletotrichum higginsianum IMI 349063]OBR04626.1 Integral membrane protein [Colletotrichum higginsianum IMI 349063]